jgi:LPXTG-site transpeptidase (sortase) family protein
MKQFIQWWGGIFIVTLVALSLAGFMPKQGRVIENKLLSSLLHKDVVALEIQVPTDSVSQVDVPEVFERPTHLEIPSVHIAFDIVHPQSSEVSLLDTYLSKGIVYYPGSGLLNEEKNLLLFGHSSNLKHVRNEAYKALTGIEKVIPGDKIFVRGETSEYVYTVESIQLVNKNQELVAFNTGKKEITISTCNTFGKKDDRYVVRASLAYHLPLAQDTPNNK